MQIVGTSDTVVIREHLNDIENDLDFVMADLPETTNANGDIAKNPVWLFPVESTNFIRIQNDVNTLQESVDYISTISKSSSDYHTAMLDINSRAVSLRTDIMEATPYMYVSLSNMLFSTIWIAAILGIFAALKRKKEQLKASDEIGI